MKNLKNLFWTMARQTFLQLKQHLPAPWDVSTFRQGQER